MIELYWYPGTRAARAAWMLEEVDIEYRKIAIDIRDAAARDDAAFRAASPMGKIPAIRDGDAQVADSSAICLYLADRYAGGQLAPAVDAPERGEFLFWMFFAGSVMEPCMAEGFGTAKANRAAHGWGDFASMIETLERRLDGRDWIMGDAFCAADVMIGSTASFMQRFKILPDSTLIGGYIERCAARPAYARGFTATD